MTTRNIRKELSAHLKRSYVSETPNPPLIPEAIEVINERLGRVVTKSNEDSLTELTCMALTGDNVELLELAATLVRMPDRYFANYVAKVALELAQK